MTDIKVGSEWVSPRGGIATVKYVGEHNVFIKWNQDGSEGERSIAIFLKNFKPKPTRRTVWLNVYEDFATCNNTKEQADMVKGDNVLFQQEVEIIDPRGDK